MICLFCSGLRPYKTFCKSTRDERNGKQLATVLQDDLWAKRAERFPEHTPVNKEYYLLRSIFEEHYPEKCALDTIPKGLSVACSTPEAICWDPAWKDMHDISGRAVAFHDAASSYQAAQEMKAANAANGARKSAENGKVTDACKKNGHAENGATSFSS